MLPAREGDCLWVRYGEPGRERQILMDGGRAATGKELRRRFAALAAARRTFELLIITHVDRDHIEGVLDLLKDPALPVRFKDIWFNGYDHLKNVKLETFGAVQGERLSKALLDGGLPWNRKWGGDAVCLPESGLKRLKLAGGMTLTLLSPDRRKLDALEPVWVQECGKAGLMPGGGDARPSEPKGVETFGGVNIEQLASNAFKADPGEANGSSIAVLAECEGKRALLTGDAHADRLVESITILKRAARRLKLDAFKVAHHASQHNISRELIELVECPRYLISTNGSYFKHPTPEAVARIVKFGGKRVKLFFNYRTRYTEVWDVPAWKERYGYDVVFPAGGQNGSLKVTL